MGKLKEKKKEETQSDKLPDEKWVDKFATIEAIKTCLPIFISYVVAFLLWYFFLRKGGY